MGINIIQDFLDLANNPEYQQKREFARQQRYIKRLQAFSTVLIIAVIVYIGTQLLT